MSECEKYGLYDGHDDETEAQAMDRTVRVRQLVTPCPEGQQTYVLYEGGLSGGLGFMPTPIAFSSLWMLEGAKMVWACNAPDWEDANRKYHEFMGWEPYKPMENLST